MKSVPMLFQLFLRESGTELADRLVRRRLRIVAGKMEGSVDVRAFSSTVITSDYDEIERVSDSLEVIFLEL